MIIIQTTIDEDKKAKDLINLLLKTNKIACGTCLLYTSDAADDP